MTAIRKILHIDMDAFYASVEQLDHPEWRGKPLAVGGAGGRGVVAAASYEAREYGVRSAMASVTARQKCPQIIFAPVRMNRYKEISKQIHNIFREFTDIIEPLSLDEAYLDVTENFKGIPSGTLIAKEIKTKIKDQLNLTASAGVSINKFLAKVASDYNKPDGLYVIPPEKAEKFVEELKIEKFFGIGKVTARKMHKIGIHKGIDLKNTELHKLIAHFGKNGQYYYDIARAIDHRDVNPNRIRKSVGVENTFGNDLGNMTEIENETVKLMDELMYRCKKNRFYGRTLTLKVKYENFTQITRSKTINTPIENIETLQTVLNDILIITPFQGRKIRLLGLSVSNFIMANNDIPKQLTLDF